MAPISERENREIEAANASGKTPVVFVHGLWLLPSNWAAWATFFAEAGYAPLTPDWPDNPETVDEARANPDVLVRKTLGQIADHTTEVIHALDRKPPVKAHSTGGLLAQMLAGRGLSAATVAIDPRARAATPSHSRSSSSGTAGRTRWTRRRGISTTPSTSPARGSRSCRWATRTSTRGREAKVETGTPTAAPC